MENKHRLKHVYKDYKNDLLSQINKQQIRPAPLVQYVAKAFPIKHHRIRLRRN
jgi:hypothetical protein